VRVREKRRPVGGAFFLTIPNGDHHDLKPFKMNGKLDKLKITVDSQAVASVEGRFILRKNEKPFRIARNGVC